LWPPLLVWCGTVGMCTLPVCAQPRLQFHNDEGCGRLKTKLGHKDGVLSG